MNDKSKKTISNFFKSVWRANCCGCVLGQEECFTFCKDEGKRPCDFIGEAIACMVEKFNNEKEAKTDTIEIEHKPKEWLRVTEKEIQAIGTGIKAIRVYCNECAELNARKCEECYMRKALKVLLEMKGEGVESQS